MSVNKNVASIAKSLKTMAKVQRKMDKRIEDAEMNSNLVKIDVNKVSVIIKSFQELEKKLSGKSADKWAAPLRIALESTVGAKIARLK